MMREERSVGRFNFLIMEQVTEQNLNRKLVTYHVTLSAKVFFLGFVLNRAMHKRTNFVKY